MDEKYGIRTEFNVVSLRLYVFSVLYIIWNNYLAKYL